jgi:hypothetical protein
MLRIPIVLAISIALAAFSDAYTIDEMAESYDSHVANGPVDIFWSLVGDREAIKMAIAAPAEGWLAIAFSKVSIYLLTIRYLIASIYNRMDACVILMVSLASPVASVQPEPQNTS